MNSKIKIRPQTAAKLAAVMLILALAVATISSLCSAEIRLVAYLDGVKLGAIEDAQKLYEIEKSVLSGASAVSFTALTADWDITYVFDRSLSPFSQPEEYISDAELYNELYRNILKDYKVAYGLYIDGTLAAANTDLGVVNGALSELRLAAQGNDGAEIRLNHEIDVKSLYYPTSVLYAGVEILDILDAKAPDLYTAEKKPASSVDISYAEDELSFLASSSETESSMVGAYVMSDSDGVTTYSLTVRETVPYETVYEQTNDLYVGSYSKKSDGKTGIKEVQYVIIYENGAETSRQIASETTVSEPVSKVIYEGTKIKSSTATTGVFIIPIKKGQYSISSTYGARTLYGKADFHRGLDFAAHHGTEIYAADGGLVIAATSNSSLGNYVMILHDNGYTTVYAHMSKIIAVKGNRVAQGELIGKVGATGIATGDHLHFEVRIGETRYNPEDYLPPVR